VTNTSHHKPAASRFLPEDYYGRFDISNTADGGKRYALPHTFGATVLALTTGRRALLATSLVACLFPALFPVTTPGSPLANPVTYALLSFFPMIGIAAVIIAVVVLLTGTRKLTRLTIREDGLIWNDQHFYPALHIWSIRYGVIHNAGKPDESFTPKIEIQVGVETITLAEGLEVAPAKLFMRLFGDDTRRYWHRHN
jgi:hypothetical protein